MEPQRWRWQLGARNAQPADAALSAWLARLDAATAGRWRAVPQGAAQAFAPATAPGAPADLTLLRDGVPVARWALRSVRAPNSILASKFVVKDWDGKLTQIF